MTTEHPVTETCLRPGFRVIRVGVGRLLKKGKCLLAIIAGKKPKPLHVEFLGAGALASFGRHIQVAERSGLPGLKRNDAVGWDCEVQALTVCKLKRGDADDFAMHVDDRTPG